MSGPATIPEALSASAEAEAGEHVFHLDEGVVRMTSAELRERAQRWGAAPHRARGRAG